VVQLSFEDDAPADPGADGDPDGVAGSPRRSHPPFPQDGTVGIVVERGRQLQPVMDNLAEREVDPPEVGREEDHSALGIQRPRRSHAHPDDLGAGVFLLSPLDGSLGQRDQPVEDVPLPGLCTGRLGGEGVQRGAVLRHAADDQVGATDVNSEDKSHPTPPHW
jgi:hypothetical protein